MSGPSHAILVQGAAFQGELRKMLLALGVTMAILIVLWLLQEWRLRASAGALDWCTVALLGAFALAAFSCFWVAL